MLPQVTARVWVFLLNQPLLSTQEPLSDLIFALTPMSTSFVQTTTWLQCHSCDCIWHVDPAGAYQAPCCSSSLIYFVVDAKSYFI